MDDVLLEWERTPTPALFSTSFCLVGVSLRVETDDAALLEELSHTVGGGDLPAPVLGTPGASFSAVARTRDAPEGYGYLRFGIDDPDLTTPSDLLLGLAAPEPIFARVEGDDPSWTHIALRGDPAPLFSLKDAHCLFRQGPDWRMAVSLLLFHRMLRMRRDAIFFHASSVGIRGRGVLFVGPRGAGKSTTALSLASRGHDFLGDDTACYLPATRELLPFRRAVGIRPGPRAKALDAALTRTNRDPAREGMVRTTIDSLLPVRLGRPVPVAGVVFLDGFAPRPQLRRIEPSRDDVALLQPVVDSLVNASPAQRVFEMIRLLAAVATYRLRLGDPDETAVRLEEVFHHP